MPTLPTRETDTRREAKTLLSAKRRPHQKSIQNEKAEKYDPDDPDDGTTMITKNSEKQLSHMDISNLHERL